MILINVTTFIVLLLGVFTAGWFFGQRWRERHPRRPPAGGAHIPPRPMPAPAPRHPHPAPPMPPVSPAAMPEQRERVSAPPAPAAKIESLAPRKYLDD